MPIIDVDNLSKDYYQYKVFRRGKLLTKALKNVSFTVKEGDFFGLLGQNGAGKSTLLRILTTNLKKSGGKVFIGGRNIDGNIRDIKKHISWMFGADYEGFGWSSIERNLRLAAYFLGLDRHKAERKVKELLEYFELYKDRKLDVWRMSSGMQAKYSLAAAMLKQPKILFLDEPLLGLDVPSKDVLRNFLTELNKEGTTIVYTDHQLHELEKVCKNVVIIEKGEKVYGGTLDALKETYRDTHVLELTCLSKKINRVLLQLTKALKFVTDYSLVESAHDVHKVKIYTTIDSKAALLQVGNYLQKKKVVIETLNAGLLSLEDVYKKFLQKHPHKAKLHSLESFQIAKETPLKQHHAYLQHRHSAVRGAACSLLLKKERKEVEKVLQKMSALSKNMQIACLQVIGDAKAPKLLQKISGKLQKRDKNVRLQLAVARGKIGDVRAVKDLLHFLLLETTCTTVLEEVLDLDKNVLQLLSVGVRKLSRHDVQFLTYHIERSKRKKELFNVLPVKDESYKMWKSRQKKTSIHGKVKK